MLQYMGGMYLIELVVLEWQWDGVQVMQYIRLMGWIVVQCGDLVVAFRDEPVWAATTADDEDFHV